MTTPPDSSTSSSGSTPTRSTGRPPVEKRTVQVDAAQLRAVTDQATGKTKIVGYAAVFNSTSEDLGGFRERIRPGAFAKTIEDCDIRALVDHNSTLVIGRKSTGTLIIREDERGVYVEIDLPDTTYARDLAAVMDPDRRDVDGMSFAFVAVNDAWSMVDGIPMRELIELHCFEVSVVTFPAYVDTSAALRSLGEFRASSPTDPTPPPIPAGLGFSPLRRALQLLALLDAEA